MDVDDVRIKNVGLVVKNLTTQQKCSTYVKDNVRVNLNKQSTIKDFSADFGEIVPLPAIKEAIKRWIQKAADVTSSPYKQQFVAKNEAAKLKTKETNMVSGKYCPQNQTNKGGSIWTTHHIIHKMLTMRNSRSTKIIY